MASSDDVSVYSLCRNRQVNFTREFCFATKVYGQLYKSLRRGPVVQAGEEPILGSVFNLDFSPNEDFVVAVTAGRAFTVHDPRYLRRIHCHYNAHDDCVNCITFLSDSLFATCSDDCTIRLWDSRNLCSSVGVLRGHTNWVKNIEYDRNSGLLFSVAFHDGVRYWDPNKMSAYSSEEVEPDNVLVTVKDPYRMRLSSDKMIVTSRRSSCLVIDDFDGKLLHIPAVQELYQKFLQNPHECTEDELHFLTSNKPSFHTLFGSRGRKQFRIVMSVTFHPTGQFVGMRHVDVYGEQLQQEFTSLYDLRKEYAPHVEVKDAHHRYLKYVDEDSPEDSVNFIKEICFSRDGRVLASPHQNGIRLLSVDPMCSALELYFDERFHSEHKACCCPDLEEVTCMPEVHSSPVLTCKFAHHDFMLASGSLAGTVAFSNPQL